MSDTQNTPTAESMICKLADMCDHAVGIDGQGFNKYDSDFGHKMAKIARENLPWTPAQSQAVLKIIKKYQNQLGGAVFIDNWLKTPVFSNEPVIRQKISKKSNARLFSQDNIACFQFEFNAEIIKDIKKIAGEYKGAKYNAIWNSSKKIWKIPVNSHSIVGIIEVAEKYEFEIEERFKEYYEKVKEKTMESKTMLALNNNQHITILSDSIHISINNLAILEEIENAISSK
jgi:hypothetical protein